jgi:hypothetical protein
MVAFGGQRRIFGWIEDEFIKRTPSKHLLVKDTKPTVAVSVTTQSRHALHFNFRRLVP